MLKHFRSFWAICILSQSAFLYAETPGTLVGWGSVVWTLEEQTTLTDITSLAAKHAFRGIALRSDGSVVAIGNNSLGWPADGGTTNIVSIGASGIKYYGIRKDGRLFVWPGIFGYPDPPANLGAVKLAALAFREGAAVLEDGRVVTWGSGHAAPPFVDALSLVAGSAHYVMLRENGIVVAWGDNTWGQTNVPPGLSNVVAIAAGEAHNLSLHSDGTVSAWGDNSQGQSAVPASLSNVKAIAAGGHHSVALLQDGRIVGWGRNDEGQLNALSGYTDFEAIHASGIGTFGITRLPVFQSNPTAGSAEAGTDLTMDVQVIASSPMSFQWLHNDSAIPGATNKPLFVSDIQAQHAGIYRLRASTAAGFIDSAAVELVVSPAAPTIAPLPLTTSLLSGTSTNLTVEARGSKPMAFQWSHNGETIPGATNATLALTNISAAHIGAYQVVVTNAFGTNISGALQVNVNFPPAILNSPTNITVLAGSNFQLRANVTGTQPISLAWYEGARYLGNTDVISLPNIQAGAGPLMLTASNAFGFVSNVVVIFSVEDRGPVIIRQPQDQSSSSNSPVLFSVAAIGTEPLSYQWFKGSVRLDSATNRYLSIPRPQPSDFGEYAVQVSNNLNAALSESASLADNATNVTSIDWPSLAAEILVTNLAAVTHIASVDDGSDRLFLVEQAGRIRLYSNGAHQPDVVLDLTDRVLAGGERGLFSMAFAPDFAQSGGFYVNYTRRPDGATVVSRFRLPAGSNSAARESEQVLLVIPQPGPNHNGGQIAFGPDQFLYIGMGDGGGQNDPQNEAQNPASLLGKMLRVDVSGSGTNYAIPRSNPFFGREDYRPEIWAMGLRNPWRFSFDRVTGDLYIADVGEARLEELNIQPRGSLGGENYGWSWFEGTAPTFKFSNNVDQAIFTFPITEYGRVFGRSVTGGLVGRNPATERLYGVYVFGDFVSGRVWALKHSGVRWERREMELRLPSVTTFGEDKQGNIYAAHNVGGRGTVVRLYDNGSIMAPTFSPGQGSYSSEQQVVLESSPGSRIHYRRDGVEPTENDPFVISGESILITTNQAITAKAYREDLGASRVSGATYNLYVALDFSPKSSPITNGTIVRIFSSSEGVTIRYSLDGSEITESSLIYTEPIGLSGNQTLKAVGFKPSWNPSQEIGHFFGLLVPEFASIQSYAGAGGRGFTDGPVEEAQFYQPQGLALDKDGNVFVADSLNQAVRKISRTGQVTTVIGPEELVHPVGVAVDAEGNLFAGDMNGEKILQLTPAGVLSRYAGTGDGSSRVDGPRETAQVMNVAHMEIAPDGTLYFGDWATVRAISPEGFVSHVGGGGENNLYWLSGDVGVGVAPSGVVFTASEWGRIFRMNGSNPNEDFELFAGAVPGEYESADGPRLEARFTSALFINNYIARDIAFDAAGNMYVSDRTKIRKIDPAGNVSTLVFSKADPINDQSPIQFATGLAIDADQNLYVADAVANRVWKIVLPVSNEQAISLAFERQAGEMVLSWDSVPGRPYHLESSSDLSSWSRSASAIQGTGSRLVVRVAPNSTTFYRVLSN